MAWTTPPTFVSGAVLTAAQLNILAADLNETGPAKFTASGQFLVATAANAGAARVPSVASVVAADTTTSTSYDDMASVGPTVTVTTGARALICMHSRVVNSALGIISSASFVISGATMAAASDEYALGYEASAANDNLYASAVNLYSGLTPGSNTFKMVYKVSTASTGTFQYRRLSVIPF